MTRQIFTVTGAGFFPLDMLRYDSCWPMEREDVEKIDNSSSEVKEMRNVTLCRIVRNKNLQPTTDRWMSFGWVVAPTSIKLYTM